MPVSKRKNSKGKKEKVKFKISKKSKKGGEVNKTPESVKSVESVETVKSVDDFNLVDAFCKDNTPKDLEERNKIYKKAALEYHPDKNTNKTEEEIKKATKIMQKLNNFKDNCISEDNKQEVEQFCSTEGQNGCINAKSSDETSSDSNMDAQKDVLDEITLAIFEKNTENVTQYLTELYENKKSEIDLAFNQNEAKPGEKLIVNLEVINNDSSNTKISNYLNNNSDEKSVLFNTLINSSDEEKKKIIINQIFEITGAEINPNLTLKEIYDIGNLGIIKLIHESEMKDDSRVNELTGGSILNFGLILQLVGFLFFFQMIAPPSQNSLPNNVIRDNNNFKEVFGIEPKDFIPIPIVDLDVNIMNSQNETNQESMIKFVTDITSLNNDQSTDFVQKIVNRPDTLTDQEITTLIAVNKVITDQKQELVRLPQNHPDFYLIGNWAQSWCESGILSIHSYGCAQRSPLLEVGKVYPAQKFADPDNSKINYKRFIQQDALQYVINEENRILSSPEKVKIINEFRNNIIPNQTLSLNKNSYMSLLIILAGFLPLFSRKALANKEGDINEEWTKDMIFDMINNLNLRDTSNLLEILKVVGGAGAVGGYAYYNSGSFLEYLYTSGINTSSMFLTYQLSLLFLNVRLHFEPKQSEILEKLSNFREKFNSAVDDFIDSKCFLKEKQEGTEDLLDINSPPTNSLPTNNHLEFLDEIIGFLPNIEGINTYNPNDEIYKDNDVKILNSNIHLRDIEDMKNDLCDLKIELDKTDFEKYKRKAEKNYELTVYETIEGKKIRVANSNIAGLELMPITNINLKPEVINLQGLDDVLKKINKINLAIQVKIAEVVNKLNNDMYTRLLTFLNQDLTLTKLVEGVQQLVLDPKAQERVFEINEKINEQKKKAQKENIASSSVLVTNKLDFQKTILEDRRRWETFGVKTATVTAIIAAATLFATPGSLPGALTALKTGLATSLKDIQQATGNTLKQLSEKGFTSEKLLEKLLLGTGNEISNLVNSLGLSKDNAKDLTELFGSLQKEISSNLKKARAEGKLTTEQVELQKLEIKEALLREERNTQKQIKDTQMRIRDMGQTDDLQEEAKKYVLELSMYNKQPYKDFKTLFEAANPNTGKNEIELLVLDEWNLFTEKVNLQIGNILSKSLGITNIESVKELALRTFNSFYEEEINNLNKKIVDLNTKQQQLEEQRRQQEKQIRRAERKGQTESNQLRVAIQNYIQNNKPKFIELDNTINDVINDVNINDLMNEIMNRLSKDDVMVTSFNDDLKKIIVKDTKGRDSNKITSSIIKKLREKNSGNPKAGTQTFTKLVKELDTLFSPDMLKTLNDDDNVSVMSGVSSNFGGSKQKRQKKNKSKHKNQKKQSRQKKNKSKQKTIRKFKKKRNKSKKK